jgi:Protein of unknown function (DUF2958)
MDIIPEDLRAKIPQLGEASAQEDPMVWAKLIAPVVGWTWYIIEMQPVPPDAIFYGYAMGWDETLEYFNLSELEQIAAVEGVTLACDPTFAPSRLSVVRARERGPAKFPFGEVVATPECVHALNKAQPLLFHVTVNPVPLLSTSDGVASGLPVAVPSTVIRN